MKENAFGFDSATSNGVIRKKPQTKKSFSNMITVIRLHLMRYVELFEFIKNTYNAWGKTTESAAFIFLSPTTPKI